MEDIYGVEAPACYFSWLGVKWIMGQIRCLHNIELCIICTDPEDLANQVADELLSEININSN